MSTYNNEKFIEWYSKNTCKNSQCMYMKLYKTRNSVKTLTA